MAIRDRFSRVSSQAQSFIGLLTIVAGFYMMWGSLTGRKQSESTLAKAAHEAVEIDIHRPSTKYIGRLVVAAGTLTSSVALGDDFLKSSDLLILQRKVEMYQWTERVKGPDDDAPEYRLDWVEGQVDFLSFSQVEGHENPLLKYDSKLQRATEVKFGGFDGSKILESIAVLPPLQLSKSMLKDTALDLVENAIYIDRTPGSIRPSLGDMRITYHGLKVGDYTIAARQVDEVTLVGSNASDDLVIKSGKLSIEELFNDVANESRSTYSGLLYVGALVLFFGIFSTLTRVAPQLDLRPKVELQGISAIALVSFAITLATMIIFSVLGMVG